MAGWVGHLHHVSDTPGEAQGPGDRDRDADTTLSCLLRTRRGMTSFVTRKRSRWKSEMMSRKTEEVFWDKYVAKLWKSYGEGKVIKRSHFPPCDNFILLFGSTPRHCNIPVSFGHRLQCAETLPKSDPRVADLVPANSFQREGPLGPH